MAEARAAFERAGDLADRILAMMMAQGMPPDHLAVLIVAVSIARYNTTPPMSREQWLHLCGAIYETAAFAATMVTPKAGGSSS